MRERNYAFLIVIIFLALLAGWIDLPDNTGIHLGPFDVGAKIHFGLDIQGGLQVLLQAVGIPCEQVPSEAMDSTKTVVESRINGLGVAEPLVQRQGPCRIVVQLPGISNPDEAIKTFGSTALLEFVDTGDQSLAAGTVIQTTGISTVIVPGQPTPTPGSGTSTPGTKPTVPISATATVSATTNVTVTNPVSTTAPVSGTVYRTVMTGSYLRSAAVQFSQTTNQPYIAFTLTDDGAKIFGDYTAKNVHKYLTITLDKTVISSPVINSAIQGSGIIEGKFTRDEANQFALQLKYGALPIPLQVIQSTAVGPTLGRDSVNKSITAGAIGLIVVVLFMLLYYRLPGLLADMALVIYALVILAIYKFGVTLTLPGIAGFILSVGLAVDANILIFERMKEELRAGRPLALAIEAGFNRAWPSIRDSNSSTLITCLILAIFGLNFGASIVAGFAITLAIGVIVSLFTAITVTRTFLRLSVDMGVASNLWWFGV